jgi:hypothetical protein
MPGVRAIRAPLAAGLLLLLNAWIAFASRVPRHPTTGPWGSLTRLEPLVSAVGLVGLVAFAAYVIGSLYLVIATPLGVFLRSLERRSWRGRHHDYGAARRGDVPRRLALLQLFPPRGSTTAGVALLPGRGMGEWVASQALAEVTPDASFRGRAFVPHEFVMGRIRQLLPPMSSDAEQRLLRHVEDRLSSLANAHERDYSSRYQTVQRERIERELKKDRELFGREPPGFERYEERLADEASELLAAMVLARMYALQWDTLPLTIVGTRPQLYGEIDRFQAEAEFRTALLGPLSLLAVVVGFAAGGWGIAIGFAVAGVVATTFAYAAREARRRANTVLANGIAAGLVPLQGDVDPQPPPSTTEDPPDRSQGNIVGPVNG